ncbi:MAG: VWA domain-containing protein [Acidobacteriota bacterium]
MPSLGDRVVKLTCYLWMVGLPCLAAVSSTETRSFPAAEDDTLIIQNDYGRVRVEVWDNPGVEARIRRIARDDPHLQNVRVVSQKSQNKIYFSSYFYDYDSESVYLNIQVPRAVNVVVWGANPAVEISGVQGYVRVYTQTGLITAKNLVSSVSLTTESGDIQFRSRGQFQRDLRMESVYGNVQCVLGRGLNLRGWVRSGGRLSWNGEVELSQGQLEKQVGVGGPLLYAASIHGGVSVRLDLDPDASSAVIPPQPRPRIEAQQERDEAQNTSNDLPPATRPSSQTSRPSSQPDFVPGHGTQGLPADQGTVYVPSSGPVYTASSSGTVDSGYALKVDVNWIYLNASVRDRRSNRSVANLRKEDFLVLEDGQPQTVEKFESNDAPFNLLLLLDVSGSTRSYMGLIKEASIEFTRQIKSNDRIGIAVFNSNTRLIQRFTNDRQRVAHSIRRVRSGGGTAFYDALATSIEDYMSGIEGRKAIVVFTDGVDNQLTGDWSSGSQTTFPELYRSIQEIDSIIYTIFLDTERGSARSIPSRRGGSVIDILGDILRKNPGVSFPGGGGAAYAEAREQLRRIADQTGGRMYTPRNIRDLTHVYSEIADDLRIQYTLAYNSTNLENDGSWREVKVRVRNRSDLAVRTRRGYYSKGGRRQP